MLSDALGAAAGPLGIGTALAAGKPEQAIPAIAPTIASGANLAGSAGLIGSEAAAGISSMAGAFAPYIAMTLLPALYDTKGDDFFDVLFGNARDRLKETKTAPDDFTQSLQKMAAGAGTLGQPSDNPNDLLGLLQTAQEGIDQRKDFGHNFDVLSKGTAYSKGQDMSQVAKVTPQLSGDNWKSWVELMDKAANTGVNTDDITGHSDRWVDNGFGPHKGEMFTDPTTGTNTYDGPAGTEGFTTKEASDLSQAIYGMAMSQGKGFDGPLPGATGNGGYLAPDQLAGFGLTPGHYEQGILDYLQNMGSMGPASPPAPPPLPTQTGMDSPGGF